MSLNGDEKKRWKVWLSLSTLLFSLQVGTATKCAPGPTWMEMDWGKGLISTFYFVIMWGPCDALLPWPFHQKVMLMLINQAGKKHQSDSFHPDPHSSSFQWPGRKEMNIASGCPMFKHLLNGDFVKDDSIYLRVVVHTSDLPTIIPWKLWGTQI